MGKESVIKTKGRRGKNSKGVRDGADEDEQQEKMIYNENTIMTHGGRLLKDNKVRIMKRRESVMEENVINNENAW